MYIRDLMTHSVITAPPTMSLALAQRLMHDHHIRHLPVVRGLQLIGLVTDRDLRQALPSPITTLTPDEITYKMATIAIATCMTREVIAVPPEADIVQGTRRLLEGPYGCLPVLSSGQLVGLVTAIDLLRGFLMDLGSVAAYLPVRTYMHAAPLAGHKDDLVSQAQQRMQSATIRHLPIVTEDGRLLGLLSDRDLRQAGASSMPLLARYEAPTLLMAMQVKDIMSTDVYAATEETTVATAGQLFLDHKLSCLPVVDPDYRLVGILTVTDLLRAHVVLQQNRAVTP
jgi:CBS domain-containing protein